MIVDCHVHMMSEDPKEDFIKALDKAGMSKAMVLAPHPNSFRFNDKDKPVTSSDRLGRLMKFASQSDRIIPIYWIDPLEDDALKQVDMAVEAGVKGFKVICNRHYPGDERPMMVWEHIAGVGKPILFHSGILYSTPHASKFNRPVNFEPLFDIPKLKFAMAHVSWPWHDECLAVFGYWSSRKQRGTTTAELFIDTSPGTPRIYREEVMTKIYTIGYDIEDNVMYGSDCLSNYDSDYAREFIDLDSKIMKNINVTDEMLAKYLGKNALRFLGM